MYKILVFLKRREGLSREEFIDYYESVHAKRAEKYLVKVQKYSRRYLEWLPDSRNGGKQGLDFDAITEIWCDTQEDFDAAMAAIAVPPASEEIEADEKHLFDRSRRIWALVTDCESDIQRRD